MYNKYFSYKNYKITSGQGATMVEFAIVFPLVLFLVLIIFDSVLYLVAKGTVERAAKQAASYAAVIEGLEDVNNSAVVQKIVDKAAVLPGAVLSKSLVQIPAGAITYEPPYVEPQAGNFSLDYRNVPVGVTITANYKPLLPFMPTSITVKGFAYREKSEASSLPVPLNCLGQPIPANGTVPPITKCPCPGANDPNRRRIDPVDPSRCDCLFGTVTNTATGLCQCPRPDQEVNPLTDRCECRLIGGIVPNPQDPNSQCTCPDPARNTIVNNQCICVQPFTGNPANCTCAVACPSGITTQDRNTCGCTCINTNTIFNPATRTCDCQITASSCGEGTFFQNCSCQLCKVNWVSRPDRSGCDCPLNADLCGGAFNFDAENCKCRGLCQFPDDPNIPGDQSYTSEGNCICNLPLLYERCGGPEYSNPQYCNCTGGGGGCNFAALEAWCGDPRPQGQGGIPVDYEHCGCRSGACTGNFELNEDEICVCPEEQKIFCENRGQPVDPNTCECLPYQCPDQFLSGGVCACTRDQLVAYCASLNPPLPILDISKCACGADCGPNRSPVNGSCQCISITCPPGATQDPGTCQCRCANNAPMAFCTNLNQFRCDWNSSCQTGDRSCECTPNGIFRQPGS